jgi:hypothetical protein
MTSTVFPGAASERIYASSIGPAEWAGRDALIATRQTAARLIGCRLQVVILFDIDLLPSPLQEKITIKLTLFFDSPNHSDMQRFKALDAE